MLGYNNGTSSLYDATGKSGDVDRFQKNKERWRRGVVRTMCSVCTKQGIRRLSSWQISSKRRYNFSWSRPSLYDPPLHHDRLFLRRISAEDKDEVLLDLIRRLATRNTQSVKTELTCLQPSGMMKKGHVPHARAASYRRAQVAVF